jgi:ribosomal protein L11 methyltransferase
VLANIHLNVLLNDGATYWQVLKPGGLLFLSGFYLQDLSIITDYYQSLGAELLYHQGMEDWCAVVFRK